MLISLDLVAVPPFFDFFFVANFCCKRHICHNTCCCFCCCYCHVVGSKSWRNADKRKFVFVNRDMFKNAIHPFYDRYRLTIYIHLHTHTLSMQCLYVCTSSDHSDSSQLSFYFAVMRSLDGHGIFVYSYTWYIYMCVCVLCMQANDHQTQVRRVTAIRLGDSNVWLYKAMPWWNDGIYNICMYVRISVCVCLYEYEWIFDLSLFPLLSLQIGYRFSTNKHSCVGYWVRTDSIRIELRWIKLSLVWSGDWFWWWWVELSWY